MKIFHNTQLMARLRRFQLRQGNNFLCRLIGISLEEDGQGTIDVYPVYRTIGIHRHSGQIIISFPWFKKEILVSFSCRGIEVVAVPSEQLELQHSDAGKEN
jgi:hypothetical protein